nr:LuxR family transcriptional regulator [Kibdelosporangium phytohabitans]
MGRAVQDDGSPPYWPFRQIIRGLGRRSAPAALADELALVVPEFGGGPATAPGERFRVFEAVTEYLTGAGKLLMVLDDLQWADQATLRLLVHLAMAARTMPVMILVTYRDTEVGEPLSDTLAALAREDSVTRVQLTGLSETDVVAHLTGLTGAAVDAETAAIVSRRTGGNPFFVAELSRILGQERMPDAVLGAVRVRLDGLSHGCREMLVAASVLGTQVDPAIVASVLGWPLDDALSALDEAVRSGVLSDPDGWRFTHNGIAAAACDWLDDAVRHLRRAIVNNERAGTPPYVAMATLDLARVLARRDRPGDADESAALAVSARAMAEELGMRQLVADAEALTGPSALSPRENEIARLAAQGPTNRQIAAAVHISVRTGRRTCGRSSETGIVEPFGDPRPAGVSR